MNEQRDLVEVEFSAGGPRYTYDSGSLPLAAGDRVIVPTQGVSPGPALATVVRTVDGEPGPATERVIRRVPPGEKVEHPNA